MFRVSGWTGEWQQALATDWSKQNNSMGKNPLGRLMSIVDNGLTV